MTDLISKEEAIKAVRKVCEKYDGVNDTYHPHIDFIEEALHNLSSIEKVGEWINDTNYSGWTCTNCNYHDGNATDNYCPNCGARMKRSK